MDWLNENDEHSMDILRNAYNRLENLIFGLGYDLKLKPGCRCDNNNKNERIYLTDYSMDFLKK